MERRKVICSIAGYLLAMAMLCVPALWNGFPLMFDDVGGYLERWPTASLGLGRSTVYGLLLWTTRWSSFVPIVLLQAFATVFVVDRALRIFGVRRLPWTLPAVVAIISVTSGAAFFVSKAIPDAWAAPAVLGLHLLAWHLKDLTKLDRLVLAGIVAFAAASHMATLGVLSGLWILAAIIWSARHRLGIEPYGVAVATVSLSTGVILLLATDVVVAGRFALTPGGDMFLMGRLVEGGMAAQVLREECPQADWKLCNFRDDLPNYSEAFIWDENSPLQKIGGADNVTVRREIRSIIVRSLITHPLDHLERALVLSAQQFLDTGTSGAVEPVTSWHLPWTLAHYAPWLLARFDGSRQQTETVNLDFWSDYVVVPVSTVSSFALPVLAIILWRRHRRREAILATTILLALIGNAAICGVISSPNDRYQARLVWLATLVLVVTGGHLTNTVRDAANMSGQMKDPLISPVDGS